jgi:hypothetical protein
MGIALTAITGGVFLGILATTGVVLASSFVLNLVLGVSLGIYSHDDIGWKAFWRDSTISLPMTFIGQLFMIYAIFSGARFNGGLSKNSNAYIFDNVKLPKKGTAIGNFVGMENKNGFGTKDDYYKVLREELAHTWQYRKKGGLFACIRLIYEQARYGKGAYDKEGCLEHAAKDEADPDSFNDEDRPWYMRGENFDKFYPGYVRPK